MKRSVSANVSARDPNHIGRFGGNDQKMSEQITTRRGKRHEKADNYNNGGGIFFAFVPIYGLPVALLALGIYFILLLLDLANKTNIKNEALVKNVYYKKFVNIFYWYFLSLNLLFFGIFICYILFS